MQNYENIEEKNYETLVNIKDNRNALILKHQNEVLDAVKIVVVLIDFGSSKPFKILDSLLKAYHSRFE